MAMEGNVFISIGSNLGNSLNNCITAIERIKADMRARLIKQSSFYKTSPVSDITQDDFINCAINILWSSSPLELLSFLSKIETEMGRKRLIPKGPREIDLDIIFFDNLLINTPQLIIPHPEAHRRKFVIIPCIEIEPHIIHPSFNRKLKDFLDDIGDEQRVELIEKHA
ncbi:MAG TPA: 2-amino-4-hydroxy-6-hydroxymethyldihydropteridine diphosphokinase [Syntrophorhabdaceae bacterium]|nr:2-amino-4-hydroxy-6-hydroxymethyldihydropteridine diphosphokinase [Syntrophorhabdaceae bacterium]